jgi:hypothetical protein
VKREWSLARAWLYCQLTQNKRVRHDVRPMAANRADLRSGVRSNA